MKKILLIATLLLTLTAFEAFKLQSTNKENKIGVWKTYQDYANGILTDMGTVTENHNSWSDHGVFFEKEHVIPADTKYWGARVPFTHLKPHSFVHHDIPEPNTSDPYRYFEGKRYSFFMSPLPIGIFYTWPFTMSFDNSDKVLQVSLDAPISAYASKGDGGLIKIEDKSSCRKMFDDDPELQKQYDKDEVTFSNKRISQRTKDAATFIMYARKYNRKHGSVKNEKAYGDNSQSNTK